VAPSVLAVGEAETETTQQILLPAELVDSMVEVGVEVKLQTEDWVPEVSSL
jgi:hypothetical protein